MDIIYLFNIILLFFCINIDAQESTKGEIYTPWLALAFQQWHQPTSIILAFDLHSIHNQNLNKHLVDDFIKANNFWIPARSESFAKIAYKVAIGVILVGT